MDIQEKILDKYDIDIDKENVLKLYKISADDLTPDNLEKAIVDTRKKWNKSVTNGTLEAKIAKDRERLEKADRYEAILRDEKLRKELIKYYNSGSKKEPSVSESDLKAIQFAEDYFRIVGTTKAVNRSDVDFFFDYYKQFRKSRPAIVNTLQNTYKVLKFDKKLVAEDDDTPEKESASNNNSNIVHNMFSKDTVKNIRDAIALYSEVSQKGDLCTLEPALNANSLYEFLSLDSVADVELFRSHVSEQLKRVYGYIQEGKRAYDPLRDVYNKLDTLSKAPDVRDNFAEFKLLIKYSELTPYMVAFVTVKKETIAETTKIAKAKYGFRDENDFITNYYEQVSDNFNINNDKIKSLIQNAQKKATKTKVITKLEEKFGVRGGTRLPIGIEILYALVYWPIFFMYIITEIVKFPFANARKWKWPIFIGVMIWQIMSHTEDFSEIGNTFYKAGLSGTALGAAMVAGGILLLMFYSAVPTLLLVTFVENFSESFNKNFDWIGLKRTIREKILGTARKNTEQLYKENSQGIVGKMLSKAIINLACLAITVLVVRWIWF